MGDSWFKINFFNFDLKNLSNLPKSFKFPYMILLCRGSFPLIDCKFVGQKVIFIQMDRIDRKESSGSGLRVGNEERDR